MERDIDTLCYDIMDRVLWRHRQELSQNEKAVLFGTWCQLKDSAEHSREEVVDTTPLEEKKKLIGAVLRGEKHVPVIKIIEMVSRLHEGIETCLAAPYFVEHSRFPGKYGLSVDVLTAMEAYVWASKWPLRHRQLLRQCTEMRQCAVIDDPRTEELIRAWLNRTAQGGLPDGEMESRQMDLVCSVHVPLPVLGRLAKSESTSYKRYRKYDEEIGHSDEFYRVIRRTFESLPHNVVATAPKPGDTDGLILDSCASLSILETFVRKIMIGENTLTRAQPEAQQDGGGEAVEATACATATMTVKTAQDNGPDWCPRFGIFYDPYNGSYIRCEDDSLIELGKFATGPTIVFNYFLLLHKSFPGNGLVKRTLDEMTSVERSRQNAGDEIPSYL